MRGASPSGSAAKPRLPPLLFSVHSLRFSFAFTYAAVRPFRSFGRVGLRRVPVSAARQRRRLFQDRHTPNDHFYLQ